MINKIPPYLAPAGNNKRGQWWGEQQRRQQPVGADPIIVVVAMAAATCGGEYTIPVSVSMVVDEGSWRRWRQR